MVNWYGITSKLQRTTTTEILLSADTSVTRSQGYDAVAAMSGCIRCIHLLCYNGLFNTSVSISGHVSFCGELLIVDTHHGVSVSHGGQNTTAMVSCADQTLAVPSLCQWLMHGVG